MTYQDLTSRRRLPHETHGLFLTDGGLETTLIFHDGIDLPAFASFPLIETDEGREAITEYFRRYAAIAVENGTAFILEAPTWRASADWGEELGYDAESLDRVNRDAVALMDGIRREFEVPGSPFLVSGCIGPRGDGYAIGMAMEAAEARAFHTPQIASFAAAGVDMVSAITMTYVEEAIGITRAARDAGVPAVISFTVETDGNLPSGQPLGAAIEQVDAATGDGPVYYMINCAHPSHFVSALENGDAWLGRIRGIRANASKMSHAELDAADELDDGNPRELGADYRRLRAMLPSLNVLGGCCGTDHRHLAAICNACVHDIAA